ncbi:hypothetical protein PIB30_080800 [Stylosanthes scabra]|uniref:Uncharacterized protein n=1 Tax=Stylosanthes scabra TaxID=79078 RepID=A0ABU6SSD3_9FABA|nr:hypothetical protein [Stylosanthes scabra]
MGNGREEWKTACSLVRVTGYLLNRSVQNGSCRFCCTGDFLACSVQNSNKFREHSNSQTQSTEKRNDVPPHCHHGTTSACHCRTCAPGRRCALVNIITPVLSLPLNVLVAKEVFNMILKKM